MTETAQRTEKRTWVGEEPISDMYDHITIIYPATGDGFHEFTVVYEKIVRRFIPEAMEEEGRFNEEYLSCHRGFISPSLCAYDLAYRNNQLDPKDKDSGFERFAKRNKIKFDRLTEDTFFIRDIPE